jgi:N-acetylglucosamine-6-phosphate deacetylase
MLTVITAAHLLTPEERIDSPVVVVEDGHILACGSSAGMEIPAGRRLEFRELILAPGFIDIHIHGGVGHDVMEADSDGLRQLEEHLLRHGVTGYLPTTVTAERGRTLSALDRLGQWIDGGNKRGRALALGIHLEGPFISSEKRGVHPPENLLEPSPEALEAFWEASGRTIRMITIAPELRGAADTIACAVKLGVHSSLGHSNATYAQARAGIAAGADHATHTFNAMRGLDHREPGIVGAILAEHSVTADIIADGIHVHPSVVKLFLNGKGREGAILITDAISATGMPDGNYKLGALEVEVKNGRCEYEGKLAGSVLTLDRAVRNVMQFAGWGLEEAVRLVTLNPARLLGSSDSRGLVAPGRRADLVVLTPTGEVVHTIVAGEIAF